MSARTLRWAIPIIAAMSAGCHHGPEVLLRLKPKLKTPYIFETESKSSGTTTMASKFTETVVFEKRTSFGYHANVTIRPMAGSGGPALFGGSSTGMDFDIQGNQISGSFSAVAMSGMGTGLFGDPLPNGAVHVGQKWSMSSGPGLAASMLRRVIGGGGNNVSMTLNSEVTNISAGTVTIHSKYETAYDFAMPSTPGGPSRPFGTKIEMDIDSEIDSADGLPRKIVQTMKGLTTGGAPTSGSYMLTSTMIRKSP